jgi:PTH1 family peptidyl-tRNA hydrolase
MPLAERKLSPLRLEPQRGCPVYLIWPLLPYNVAGWCVRASAKRFSVSASAVTILHDDLDKSVGQLCWKFGGSAGGNNGVRSVMRSLGTAEFRRLRVGIGRPPTRDPLSRHSRGVLKAP